MIKCILLDNDGVIVKSSEMFSERISRENNIPPENITPFFKEIFIPKCMTGKTDLKKELIPWLPKWKWEGTIDELLQYWFKSEHNIDKDVEGHIKKIKSQGIRCYLVTNQEKYRTAYLKKEMGFNELFDGIFSSAEIGYKKPSTEFYEKIFKQINKNLEIRKDEILYVDDDESNVTAGKEFGFNTLHYKSFKDLQSLNL